MPINSREFKVDLLLVGFGMVAGFGLAYDPINVGVGLAGGGLASWALMLWIERGDDRGEDRPC